MAELIGAIYGCVLAPSQWQAVLETICRVFNFQNGILAINGFDGHAMLGALVGVEENWLGRMLEYGAAVTDLWGGPLRIQEFPLEEPIVQSHVATAKVLLTNSYFQEWARPQGIIYAVAIGLERSPTMISNLALGRHETAGDISEAELEGLRILAPHLRRAVNISKVLELKTIEAATFASVLENFTVGIAFVDHNNALIHANAAAHAMLAAKDPLYLNAGRLALPLEAATTALDEAVRKAAAGDPTAGTRGVGIPAMRKDGTPAVVHVMPLRREIAYQNLALRPTAALFIAPAAAAWMPTDAIALLYGFTPAESRIFEMIAAGEPPTRIANRLGLALSTVKTHLLRVFEKTGCKRQVDIVKLAASLSLTF